MVRWWGWWRKREQARSATYSLSDPRLAALFGAGVPNYSGVEVTETTALTLSAVWRAAALISGTIASLPLNTLRDRAGKRDQVASFLADPGGPYGPTPFEWAETTLLHLVLHGEAFLAHVFNGVGSIVALEPIHPLAVSVRWRRPDEDQFVGTKVFTVTLLDGVTRHFDVSTMTQVMYMSLDGLRGLSPIAYARNSLGTAIAGDRAAAKMFNSGALLSGVLTPADGQDLDEDEAKLIRQAVARNVGGWENAAEIAVINRSLTFTPWTMSAEDLQFLQSRQFQIEEVARWFGVPPHLLMQTEKQTSWGQGVESQNRAMGRTVLLPWTRRIEQRLSRLLPPHRWAEFDFAELERPTPEAEAGLLIQQTTAGLLTANEARHRMNLPPLPGGGVLRINGQPLAAEPADEPPPDEPPSVAEPAVPDRLAEPQHAITRADPEVVRTKAMVALLPSAADAARLAVDGGETADELHLTLMSLGDAAPITAEARALLVDQVAQVAAGIAAVEAKGFAVSMFNPGGEDACIVLGVTGAPLDDVHATVVAGVDAWAQACGLVLPEQHAPWVPHVTLAYTGDVAQLAALVDRVGLITFDAIRVVVAGDATDIPLALEVP